MAEHRGEGSGSNGDGSGRAAALAAAVSRRRVLGWSLAVATGAAIAGKGIPSLVSMARTAAAGQGTALWVSFTRPADQLDLRWELLNVVRYKAGEGPGDTSVARIAVADPGQPAFLVVHFPPQNVGERAYFAVDGAVPGQSGDETPQMSAPIPSALAAPSRLAFRLLPGAGPIPFTPEGLLNWTGLALSVVPPAARARSGRPGPQAPSSSQTAIEAPWGVVLSPDEEAGWAHSLTPVTYGDRTELWHTRLGVRQDGRIDEADAAHRTVRAVWTPGYSPTTIPATGDPGPNPPGRTSLSPRQRYQIVRLSSDHSMDALLPGGGSAPYQPRPIAVNRLMLSTLGAWADTDGSWDVPLRPAGADLILDVEEWLHKATMGRDHYVKVVEAGFLFPFGHRASRVIITERVFEPVPDAAHPTSPPLAAVNRQRMFVVVREAERSYPDGLANQPHGGRAMPFKKVRITSTTTPSLAGVEGSGSEPLTRIAAPSPYNPPFYGADAFWPVVATPQGPKDFLFALEGEDAQGRRSQFTAPLIFVRGAISASQEHTKHIIDAYAAATAARRERPMGGQRIALTSLPGESTYPVASVTLGAEQPDPPNAPLDGRHQPRFFPTIAGAAVQLDAAEEVSGKPAGAGPVPISWYGPYLDGLKLNPGQLFAVLPNPLDLAFPGDALGALATPDLRIGGLSALTGVVGGALPAIPPLNFDPAAFFAGAAPKILGALPLTAILSAVDFSLPSQLPQLLKAELPDAITTSYTWRPRIQRDADSIFDPGTAGALTIRATATVRRKGGPPSFEVTGELTNFALNAFGVKDFGMLTLNFRKLRFSARDGLKATVDADLSGVTFHGVLEFINPLQDFLAKLGVVPPRPNAAGLTSGKARAKSAAPSGPPPNGPDISVTAAGIRAGYTLALPSVPIGVFSLENIVLSSVLNIPFLGDPARVRFAFADRERPFLLTVAMFGGGGFCALQLGLDGFERFEAALEFGAKLGLDLGVASGGVSVMAGIYFALGKSSGELSGYVRINGELRILGLVSLGLEFYLGLTLDTGTGEVSGQARLTVSIDIAFFSTSVTLGPIEKRFGGGSKTPPGAPESAAKAGRRALAAAAYAPPPALGELVSEADWSDPVTGYCALFAPAAFA